MQSYLYLFLFLFIGGPLSAHAQGGAAAPEKPLLNAKDSLHLMIIDGQKMVLHRVKPKQTLYTISHYYSLNVDQIYAYNPVLKLDQSLRVGSQIMIPIPNIAIKRYKTADFKPANHVPIYYVVQQGDNLFGICKRQFNMSVDTIVRRNSIKNNAIRPGQLLLVGWMNTQGILPEWRLDNPVLVDPNASSKYDQDKSGRKEIESQGVCFWHRDSKEAGDLYALHQNAAIGTLIAVTNPMGNRTIYAKVIGRIPDGYDDNIEIILSPEAARRIGARDPRFFVKIKYLK